MFFIKASIQRNHIYSWDLGYTSRLHHDITDQWQANYASQLLWLRLVEMDDRSQEDKISCYFYKVKFNYFDIGARSKL